MQPKKSDRQRSFLCPDLLDQLDPRNHLLGLAKAIPWNVFEDNFRPLYAASGRPGKPVRLMVGLLILKQLENLSDERVVDIWVQNPYFQAFCGQQRFTWKLPCDPSELTYFRRRIGEDGVRKIFEVSVALHGDKAKETEVVVDSTVQEKNITFPTDAKLLTKIVTRATPWPSWKTSNSGAATSAKSSRFCGPSGSNQKVADRANPSGQSGVCGPSPASWSAN